MELAQAIANNRAIALDTNIFIYAYQEHPQFLPIVRPIFDRLDNDPNFRAVTSVITLIEVLAQPLRLGRSDLVSTYTNALINSSQVATHPIDFTIARRAAELRAKHDLRTPDAIQIATAITAQAEAFITNDERFKRITDIPVFVISEFLK